MSKKTWIKIKRGLILDPKHRKKMGESRWLYDYMLDKTNWDSGQILEWVDRHAADEMEMPLPTLRKHRYRLEEEGYISCVQNKHNQTITIHNWTNPREYSGKVYNKKNKGNQRRKPSKKAKDNPKGDSKVIGDVVTSTSNPQVTNHNNNTNEPEYIDIGKEFEALEKKPKKGKMPKTLLDEYAEVITMVTGMDLKLNRGQIYKVSKNLWLAGYVSQQIKTAYSVEGAWYKTWPGNKGQKPRPDEIPKTIKNLLEQPQTLDDKVEERHRRMYGKRQEHKQIG